MSGTSHLAGEGPIPSRPSRRELISCSPAGLAIWVQGKVLPCHLGGAELVAVSGVEMMWVSLRVYVYILH